MRGQGLPVDSCHFRPLEALSNSQELDGEDRVAATGCIVEPCLCSVAVVKTDTQKIDGFFYTLHLDFH